MLLYLFLCVLPCFVQTNVRLEVIARDPSGAVVDKAQVYLIKDGKLQSKAQTNQRGEARITKVAAGRYQVHIEAVGFKTVDVDVDLTPV